jgi:hypothetical protein
MAVYMENLFIILFIFFLVSTIAVYKLPSQFLKNKTEPEIKQAKIGLIVLTIVFFILFGVSSDASKQNVTQNKQNTIQPSITSQNNPIQINEANKNNNLIEHEIIPDEIHGTTRRIIVIIPTDTTQEQVIALNDKLIDDYAKGLTHLSIEYFDDKAISTDYFQKLSKVEEKVADEMFRHYKAGYRLNKVTNYNQLQFNVNNDWIILKKY